MSLINPTPEQQAALREFGRAQEEWRASFKATMDALGAAANAGLGAAMRAVWLATSGGSNS